MTTNDQLHNQRRDQLVYTCNICKANVCKARFHCTVCVEFDLCIKCHSTAGHVHEMQFELGDEAAGGEEQKQINPQESNMLAIQRCVACLEHACQCRETNCHRSGCQKLKEIVSHSKTCEDFDIDHCAICKQLFKLTCYHVQKCQKNKCPVLFCFLIKERLKQQRLMSEIQILKRSIAASAAGNVELPWSTPNPETLSSSAMPQLLASLESLNLHNKEQPQLVHSCSICKENIVARFHCTVCVDFDLCVKCRTMSGHVHEMQRLGFKERGEAAGSEKKRTQESSRLVVHLILEHAIRCREANCRTSGCQKLKKVILHAKTSHCKRTSRCIMCKHTIALNRDHAKHCQKTNCPVILYLNAKHKPNYRPMPLIQILKRRVAANAVRTPQGMSNGTLSVSTELKYRQMMEIGEQKRRLAASARNYVGTPQGMSNVGTLSVSTELKYRQMMEIGEQKRRLAASARNSVGTPQGMSNTGTSSVSTKLTHRQMTLIEVLKRRLAASAPKAVETPQTISNTGTSSAVQQKSSAQVLEQLLQSLASLNL